MMKKHYFFPILVMLLSVFLCHPAFAAKCVRPNGNGGCFPTIGQAINAVAPGGTVKVYPGIYYENFYADKAGITILGMGNKRTDVRVAVNGGDGGSCLISAENVTIKNLTIQNGPNGILIDNTASGAKMINVNFFNSVWHGIDVGAANDILIKKCKISISGDDGVHNISGERLTVQDTIISHCGENGIYCGGNELTVDGCTIKNSELNLIHVTGSEAVIHDNQLFQAGNFGIYADSDQMKITENMVKGSDQMGIYSIGTVPVLKKNTVMHSQSDGFYISCEGACSDSKVVNNFSNYNDFNGFYIGSVGSGMLIKKNKAFNNGLNGFLFGGIHNKNIAENQAKYNKQYGFYLNGIGTLEDNIASENGMFGFSFESPTTTAIQNKAFNNMVGGFRVDSEVNTLRRNRAIGNFYYGIQITAGRDSNDIINNTMFDSLYDKCDQGTNNTWTGNDYDTECP